MGQIIDKPSLLGGIIKYCHGEIKDNFTAVFLIDVTRTLFLNQQYKHILDKYDKNILLIINDIVKNKKILNIYDNNPESINYSYYLHLNGDIMSKKINKKDYNSSIIFLYPEKNSYEQYADIKKKLEQLNFKITEITSENNLSVCTKIPSNLLEICAVKSNNNMHILLGEHHDDPLHTHSFKSVVNSIINTYHENKFVILTEENLFSQENLNIPDVQYVIIDSERHLPLLLSMKALKKNTDIYIIAIAYCEKLLSYILTDGDKNKKTSLEILTNLLDQYVEIYRDADDIKKVHSHKQFKNNHGTIIKLCNNLNAKLNDNINLKEAIAKAYKNYTTNQAYNIDSYCMYLLDLKLLFMMLDTYSITIIVIGRGHLIIIKDIITLYNKFEHAEILYNISIDHKKDNMCSIINDINKIMKLPNKMTFYEGGNINIIYCSILLCFIIVLIFYVLNNDKKNELDKLFIFTVNSLLLNIQ